MGSLLIGWILLGCMVAIVVRIETSAGNKDDPASSGPGNFLLLCGKFVVMATAGFAGLGFAIYAGLGTVLAVFGAIAKWLFGLDQFPDWATPMPIGEFMELAFGDYITLLIALVVLALILVIHALPSAAFVWLAAKWREGREQEGASTADRE